MARGTVVVEIRPRDQSFLELYKHVLIKVGYHFARFYGYTHNVHCWTHCDFSLSGDLIRPRDTVVISLCMQKPIKLSYHFAKFGGHRLCVSRNIMVLF